MNLIKKELIPSTEEMMNWSTEIFNQGIRRPGYPADYWTENWIRKQFEAYDLQDIKFDPISVKKWESSEEKLKIWLVDKPSEIYDIPCFPIPYTSLKSEVEGELSKISVKTDLTGMIGVSEVNLLTFPVNMIKFDRYYDPKNEFETLQQTVPFSLKFQDVLSPALDNNALAYVGILSGYPWETDKYYVPYEPIERSIPGVWVSGKNGKVILDLLKKGNVKAKISYKNKISDVISHNITGTLPGKSNEWIIIGSHHDGPWNSAVEDISGIVMVLAQAKYWSQIPKEQRPFNLMFLMNCAHMAGGVGTQEFVKRNEDFLKNVVTAIHLEHAARDVKSEDGKLIPLDAPAVRWWFVNRIMTLEEILEEAIIEENLERSIIFPPDGLIPGSDKPPTDAWPYTIAGVPFISFLTAPPYLFDDGDTLDKIHQESYESITRTVIKIINSLKGYNAKDLRDQILTKKERYKIRNEQLQ
ncbi:MAG: M28 family peptidase [Candidatus Thorarchaeota archaeon]